MLVRKRARARTRLLPSFHDRSRTGTGTGTLTTQKQSIPGCQRARSWPSGLLCLSAFVSACVNLPDIPSGVCGNGIVEQGEDCDPFRAADAPSCRPPGSSGACHIDCALGSDGVRRACQAGFGCDVNDLCREPTGTFEAPTSFVVGGATSLLAGDFDGDGRQDLVSRPPRDHIGRAPLQFHYFDRSGGLSESRSFPKSVYSPVVADLTGDRRSDFLFSGFDVGLMLGRADRAWVPETFSSFTLPESQVRTLNVYEHQVDGDSPVSGDSALVVLTSSSSGASLSVLDPAVLMLSPRATLSGPLSTLAGQPVSANVIEAIDSPCEEVLLAYRGATSFELYDLCTLGVHPGTVAWRPQAVHATVSLVPPVAIEGAPLLADLNADGHLDVLISGAGKPYAALGDGRGLAPAVPYELPLAVASVSGVSLPMPLAAGDLTGDGQVDFVLSTFLLTSWRGPGEPGLHYEILATNDRGAWTAAAIADLNGNGHPDVIAVSGDGLGIDFFNGASARELVSARLPTAGLVLQLTVGDFDGDLINDIAYIEAASSAQERESLVIAFGVRDEAPSKGVPVARLAHTDQLVSYREDGIGNLVVAASQTIAGKSVATVAPLNSGSDRIPYAGQRLISFASDGSLQTYPVVTMSAGRFSARDQIDVLSVSTLANNISALSWQLWLLPAVASTTGTPKRLDAAIDPRLQPGFSDGMQVTLRMRSAAADLDADGLDEFLVLAPVDGALRCGVERFAGNGQTPYNLISRGLLVLDAPCSEPEFAVADLNADAALDLVVLTGSSSADHKLFVLWSDHAGGFSPAQQVSGALDSPLSFSVLPPTAQRPQATLAYVTEHALVLVAPAGTPDQATPRQVATLERGSGVVSADIDGDGVLDLAVVDAGDLKLFKAQLRTL